MRSVFTTIALVCTAVIFAASLVWILCLRFEYGDIYPRYCSLRSDPYGTKGFYDGLKRIEGIQVRRNYLPLDYVKELDNTTLVLLGTPIFSVHSKVLPAGQSLINQIAQGARLVISFCSYDNKHKLSSVSGSHSAQDPNKITDKKQKKDCPRCRPLHADDGIYLLLSDVFGFDLCNLGKVDSQGYTAKRQEYASAELALVLKWHGKYGFDLSDPDWHILYSCNQKPVLAERHYKRGTVVLMADTYLLSNEAMVRDRQSSLLCWLIGSCDQVVFDETHLGVSEKPGIVTLARKYRLHGVAAGLIFMLVIFIWSKSAGMFLRKSDAVQQDDIVHGKDMQAGLLSLLQRHIKSGDLLNICYDQWCKAVLRTPHIRRLYQKQTDQVHDIIKSAGTHTLKQEDIVRIYNQITHIIDKKENHECANGTIRRGSAAGQN